MFVFLVGFVAAFPLDNLEYQTGQADVVYVYRNDKMINEGFVEVFEDMGLSVEFVSDKDIKDVDFSGYDFVFVGDERLGNLKYLVGMPVILANPYYAKDFGFIGRGRISKTSANAPLRVGVNPLIEVYDRASFKLGSRGIPYYYIPAKYQDSEAEGIAKTPKGYRVAVGDVISYLPDKCFFGIVEAEYWTEDARNMFRGCVEHVFSGGIHDVEIVGDYVNGVNGVRIKDVDSGDYLLDSVAVLECNKSYKVDFKTVNVGERTENVLISGVLGSFNWSATRVGLLAGASTTTGSKTFVPGEVGVFDLVISAFVEEDATPQNNQRSRSVEVVCD